MLNSYGKCITAGIDKWALTPESADVVTKAILADCRLIAQAYEANRVVEFFDVGSFRGEAAKLERTFEGTVLTAILERRQAARR
jgi:hypothetical protein